MFKEATFLALDSLFRDKIALDFEGLQVSFQANPGLKSVNINLFLPLEIPSDYKDLLKKYNGFTLYEFQDLGGFSFFDANQMRIETQQQKEAYEDEWEDRIILIATIIADGDFIGLRILDHGGYEVLDGYHDEVPQNWEVITDSLDVFLWKLIESRGKRFWLS